MAAENLVAEALALYSKLSTPPSRGIAGMIDLTRLNRLLNKIGPSGRPASITSERLAEIREGNLITAATHAMAKARNRELSIHDRLKQLGGAEHYISKANCGWQVLNLTERKFIKLKTDLLQERIASASTDKHYARHYRDEALAFVVGKANAGLLSKGAREKLSTSIGDMHSAALARLRTHAMEHAAAAVQSAMEEGVSPENIVEQLASARTKLTSSGAEGREAVGLIRQIDALSEKANQTVFTAKAEAILQLGSGLEAYKALDKIEDEMYKYYGWGWSDLGFDKNRIGTARATFAYDEISKCRAAADKLLAVGDDKGAFKTMQSVRYMLSENYEAIGKNIGEAARLFEKLFLFAGFRDSMDEHLNPVYAFNQMDTALEQLRHAGFRPGDINSSFTEAAVTQIYERTGLRAVENELTGLIQVKPEPDQTDIEVALRAAAYILGKIGGSWDGIAGVAAVRELAKTNGVAFPEPTVN